MMVTTGTIMAEKILIVDDDPETLRLISLVLQRQGFQVFTSPNGAEALQVTQAETPDLILLDVMMPDQDGYAVTRQIRGLPQSKTTPILMFSARTQVEDRLAGYDAGVDEYLTKPIHPAELTARIRSQLARSKKRDSGPVQPRGFVIGVMAPKGGLGASTLTLNLAIALNQKFAKDVIAVEMRPGHGSWAFELELPHSDGLNKLLDLKPELINPASAAKELYRSSYGVRLLPASNNLRDTAVQGLPAHYEAVVRSLAAQCDFLLLDIGPLLNPAIEKILPEFDEILLLTEPNPNTVKRSKILLTSLSSSGMARSQLVTVVVVNRVRSDIQLTLPQIQTMMGIEVKHVISPAPEAAHQAALNSKPLIKIQPESLVARQFEQLAETIIGQSKR
jgi:CheY-like chemotaxis protein